MLIMLISTHERLDVLLGAQEEIRLMHGSEPSRDFHESKLAESWRRASKAAAYQGLPEYSPGAFADLAVTPKGALKADPWSFTAVDLDGCAKYYETTGTSGSVTPTPRLFEDTVWNVVSVAQAWGRVLRPQDRVAVLLPSDIVPVGDLAVGVCEYLDLPHSRIYPFATGISDWDRLITMCQSLRPTVLFVAPGLALQLTRLLKQRGRFESLSRSVRALMLLGEVSTPALRDRIGMWWDATVFDASYGSTETGTLAATCLEGQLHLLSATNYFELSSDGGAVPLTDGARGRLIVTPLNMHARPLLRFDTGDDVVVGGGCACDDAAPVVTIHGRGTDGIRIHGADLTVRDVEDAVYRITTATGYLVEYDETGFYARLLLERDVSTDRAVEATEQTALREEFRTGLGVEWDAVAHVNTLPTTTKSGGSQKSWKKSNTRIVERPA
ncbi:MAG: hypothetical protein WKF47_15975 [Geodermatophilaceae bacterium]